MGIIGRESKNGKSVTNELAHLWDAILRENLLHAPCAAMHGSMLVVHAVHGELPWYPGHAEHAAWAVCKHVDLHGCGCMGCMGVVAWVLLHDVHAGRILPALT